MESQIHQQMKEELELEKDYKREEENN